MMMMLSALIVDWTAVGTNAVVCPAKSIANTQVMTNDFIVSIKRRAVSVCRLIVEEEKTATT